MKGKKSHLLVICLIILFPLLAVVSTPVNASPTLRASEYCYNWYGDFTEFSSNRSGECYARYSNQTNGVMWKFINSTYQMTGIYIFFELNVSLVVNFTIINLTMTYHNSTIKDLFFRNITGPYYQSQWYNMTLTQNVDYLNVSKAGSYFDRGAIHLKFGYSFREDFIYYPPFREIVTLSPLNLLLINLLMYLPLVLIIGSVIRKERGRDSLGMLIINVIFALIVAFIGIFYYWYLTA